MMGLDTGTGTTAEVVWAGCGGGADGALLDARGMARVREAVASDRAARNRASKLKGHKPYSAHGF